MLCNHPLCRTCCQTSSISYIPGWLGDGTYIYTDYAVRWLALSKRSCSIHTDHKRAESTTDGAVHYKMKVSSTFLRYLHQYRTFYSHDLNDESRSNVILCIQSQSSFSLLPCKHSQMHEKREQLKIDCTCMDVTLYKPLNPGQPNLYHMHLLGSVGGWSWTMTSGFVYTCSCCHWSSGAIRKHMWSIRAPSTQIHAAMSRNQLSIWHEIRVSLSGENQVLHMPAGPQPVTRTHGTTTTANSVNILRLWCPPDIDGCELQFAAISIR